MTWLAACAIDAGYRCFARSAMALQANAVALGLQLGASLIYRRTKNIRAVQILLRHTKLESTVRYLGIEVDDALEMAERTEV